MIPRRVDRECLQGKKVSTGGTPPPPRKMAPGRGTKQSPWLSRINRKISDVGAADRLQDLGPQVLLEHGLPGALEAQGAFARNATAVDLPDEVVGVLSDQVDDVLFQRLGFGGGDTLTDRLLHPLRVAAPVLGDTLGLGHHVVDHFFGVSRRRSLAPAPTGWAAPMLVPGAMAAMSAAIVTITPAEARAGRGHGRRRPARRSRGCPDDQAMDSASRWASSSMMRQAGLLLLGGLDAVVNEFGRPGLMVSATRMM